MKMHKTLDLGLVPIRPVVAPTYDLAKSIKNVNKEQLSIYNKKFF